MLDFLLGRVYACSNKARINYKDEIYGGYKLRAMGICWSIARTLVIYINIYAVAL